jgi:hypothetical protein
MLRIIALLLTITLLVPCASKALARTLEQDEVWSGVIKLDDNVQVPPGITLTISPGTRIITNGNQILSHGTINILGGEEKEVRFHSFYQISNSEIELLKVKPYDFDTKILMEEFNKFKIQYAILWSCLFASMFIMLKAR